MHNGDSDNGADLRELRTLLRVMYRMHGSKKALRFH
jgi:hypothetical protein